MLAQVLVSEARVACAAVGRLVTLRHGETAWSRTGQHTSRTDLELTDEGRRAARLVRPRLELGSFALVLASPRQRAVESCRLAGFEPTVEPDLVEWDYGDYEGRTTVDIRAERPGWTIWEDPIPGGERPEQVAARVDRVIARARAVDGDVLAVAHAHVLRVLAARWLGMAPEAGRSFGLSTTGLSILGTQREDAVVELWNDTSHLHVGPRGDWDRLPRE